MHMRPWVEIADELRERIQRGDYPIGGRLPSGSDLMQQYGVARQTVQNAVDQLRAEGLVRGVAGRGWHVAEPRPVIRLARNQLDLAELTAGRAAFVSDAAARTPTAPASMGVRREPAPPAVATFLQLSVEAAHEVVVREHAVYAGNDVVQLVTSYQPVSEGDEDAPPAPATHHTEVVAARAPRPREADLLQVSYGFPVIQVTRVAFAGNQPVLVEVEVMSSDRVQLVYQVEG